MKQTSIVILICALICSTMGDVVSYWFGYYVLGCCDFPFEFLRATFWLVVFLLTPASLIIWITSVVTRKDCFWTTVMLAGVLALLGIKIILPHTDPDGLIICGLRDRITLDYKLDVLRNFARDIDTLPTPKDLPSDVGKLFISCNLDLVKAGLKEKYPFLKGHNVPSSIIENDGVVNVWWGRYHWGFSVVVNGEKTYPKAFKPFDKIILPVSNDIYFSARNSD